MPEDNANASEGSPLSPVPGSLPVKPEMPRPGELFAGRYEIERLLGRGGMGEVFSAVQRPLGRRVAVKILKTPDSPDDDPKFEGRFLREAEAAARLTHPNTITVFDFGQTDDGVLFIVMEYLEGNDVRTVLRHSGQLLPPRAIHVAKQVCKSLREAHRKGIVHRDLKPANVLLLDRDDDPDFAKVLDFGLVKFRGEASELTLAGKFLGSPRYTSPEALDRNKEVDHRADIYAVGILLYAMITGEPPFDGDPMQVLSAHLHEVPQAMYKASPSAKTTPELEALVARCLQKDPDRRFQSMSALLSALRDVGSFYGDHDTETIDFENAEESIDLDDSVSPAKVMEVLRESPTGAEGKRFGPGGSLPVPARRGPEAPPAPAPVDATPPGFVKSILEAAAFTGYGFATKAIVLLAVVLGFAIFGRTSTESSPQATPAPAPTPAPLLAPVPDLGPGALVTPPTPPEAPAPRAKPEAAPPSESAPTPAAVSAPEVEGEVTPKSVEATPEPEASAVPGYKANPYE